MSTRLIDFSLDNNPLITAFGQETRKTAEEFKKILDDLYKVSDGVEKLKWVANKIQTLLACERFGTVFQLEQEEAKLALEYGKFNEIILTDLPYCIIDGQGAVLFNPPIRVNEKVVGLDVLVYINANTAEHYLSDALLGLLNVEEGSPDSRHFTQPLRHEAIIYRKTDNGGAVVLDAMKDHESVLASFRDIIQSVAVALDQSFYIKEKKQPEVFNVPVFAIAVSEKATKGN